jgi:hypothetical protein
MDYCGDKTSRVSICISSSEIRPEAELHVGKKTQEQRI